MIFAPEDTIVIQVLMVDDDAATLDVVKTALERDGDIKVETARSAKDAMELMSSSPWDVVISDYLMPETDGIEFLRAVRSLSEIPFIILTAKTDQQVIVEAINNGANGYVQKDEDAKILFAKLSHQVREVAKRHRAEKALKESEERYRSFLRDFPGVVFQYSGSGPDFFHGKIEDITGYTEDDFIEGNVSWETLIHPDDLLLMKEIEDKSRSSTGYSAKAVCRIVRRDGESRWASIQIQNICNDSGDPTKVQGVAYDVTEQKQMEEMLEASEEERAKEQRLLEKYLDATSVIFLVLERDGTVRRINKEGRRLLGQNDVLGDNWFERFVPKGARKEAKGAFSEVLRGNLEPFRTYENPIVTAGDEKRTILWTNSVLKDPDGNVEVVISSGLDITERKRAEETLKMNEERLRLAIDGGTLGIWDWDITAGDIAYSGSLSSETFGYSNEEFKELIRFWCKLVHPDDLPHLRKDLRDHFRGLTSRLESDCRLKSKYGDWMWAHVRGEVMSRDAGGHPLRMLGILQDITEQKEAENRLEHLNLVLLAIRNVNQIIVKENDPDRLIKKMCNALVETRGYHNVWIALTDESGRFVKFAESGLGNDSSIVKESLERGDLAKCARTALNCPQTVIGASLISTCEVCPLCKIHTERGVLTARLEHNQKIYGIISIAMPTKFVLDEEEMALFEELAGDVAFALQGIEKENALSKSRVRLEELELIVNRSPAVAFTWQASEGWPVELVSGNVKQFGYTPEELYSGNIKYADIIHPDDLDRVAREVARYSQEGAESFDQVYRVITSSGDVRWISDDTWIRRDSEGRITHYQGIVLDITNRKRAEEELRIAHRQLSDIIEYLPDATFAIDQNGTVTAWNRAIERMTDVPKEDMIGKGDLAYSLPFYGTERPILIDMVFSSRDILEDNYQNFGTDACSIFGEAFTPNIFGGRGAYLWGTASPMFDEDGNVIGAIESIRDVTDRKLLEAELCTEREKFQVLSESAPFGMVIIDESGLFEYVNPKFEELFGYDLNDVPTGREWFRKAYPDPVQRHDLIATWIRDIEHHDILDKISRTFTVNCKDGRNIITRFITVKLPNGKYLVSCEDVTERKQAEEKLHHAHQQLMDIIDFLPDATFVVDQNSEVIAWNRAIEKMTGVPKEEMIRKGNLAYALPFYGTKRPMLVDLITSGCTNPDKYYVDIKSSDGSFLVETFVPTLREGKGAHVWAVASSLLDGDGNVSGAIESIRDVTEWRQAEEALKESEARYKAVVESQVDAICRWLPDTTLTFVNEGYCSLVDKKQEELLGQKWVMFVPENVRNDIVENYALLSKAPRINVYEHEVMGIDGQIHYVEWVDCPILDSQGNVAEFQSVGRDLTVRRQAEKALKESEERLELAVEAANFGIWDWNLRTNNVVRNDRYVEMLGLSSNELNGCIERWMERIHPEDRTLVNIAIQDHIEEKSPYYEQVYRIRHKDGRWIWVRARGKLVAWDENGCPLRMAGVVLDITERKEAEEELRKSNEILDKIFSSLDNALLILDSGMPPRILKTNPESLRMFGYREDEMIGQEIAQLHVDEDSDLDFKNALYSRLEDQGYLSFFEFKMKRKNGEIFPTENSVFPLEDGIGNRIGWISVIRDITKRKEAEVALRRSRDDLEMRVQERTSELEAKNAEMERFVYTVSHDLRSPLFTIQGFVGFLKEDMVRKDQDNAETDLRMIEDAISKMDHLLKDTLELSRIGRITNPPEEVPFDKILQESLDQVSEKIRQNEVEIVLDDNWPSVYVDRLRIGEVLINLVENSIKYMGDQQSPRIEIGWRNDDGEVVFFVKDNGIGIDPTQQDKVFDLFYKVDSGSEGTGAGLAIVKRIIEVHGGAIWIESEVGEGCTICLTLGGMR